MKQLHCVDVEGFISCWGDVWAGSDRGGEGLISGLNGGRAHTGVGVGATEVDGEGVLLRYR